MGKRWEIVALAAILACEGRGLAQPQLPPPPPPPIDDSNSAPALPPPPAPPDAGGPARSAPRRTAAPPRPPPRAVAPRPRRVERTDDAIYSEPPPARPLAVTLNPLGLFWGRVSANLEYQLLPHHSLFVSPNLLLGHVDRGGGGDVLSEGLGFATATSAGIGVELGYHYWWDWARALRGPFIGPALLLGGTSQATVGDASRIQPYWGVALDVGWQEVLPVGVTAGVGAGIEYIEMAGVGRVVPRLLLQVGWSF